MVRVLIWIVKYLAYLSLAPEVWHLAGSIMKALIWTLSLTGKEASSKEGAKPRSFNILQEHS